MRRLKAQSAGVVAMLMLIGLAVLGIVNALSSDSLVVSGGALQVAGIHADWECSWTNDDGETTVCPNAFGSEPAGDTGLDPVTSGNPWGFSYSVPFVPKDVGSCLATVPPADDGVDDQMATVMIANAYPSYECTFTLIVSNSGLEPFTIGGFTNNVVSPLELLDDTCTTTEEDLDVGEMAAIECTIHVMQEADQQATYGFTISACSGPCDGTIIERAGLYHGWRQAPAEISLRVASEVR